MQINLKTKILGVTIVPALSGMIILAAVLLFLLKTGGDTLATNVRNNAEKAVGDKLKGQIEVAANLLKSAKREGLSDEQQLKMLKKLRFGNGGYIWVHSFDSSNPGAPKMIMHPIKPALDGKDLSGLVDKNKFKRINYRGHIYPNSAPEVSQVPATALFVEMNRAVANAGGGVVRYYWPKPNGEPGVGYLKMSYVKKVNGGNWVLGTGEYADNIDHMVASQQETIENITSTIMWSLIGVSIGVIIMMLAASLVLTKQIVDPMINLSNIVENMAKGDFAQDVDIDRKDEIGQMADAVKAVSRFQTERAALADAIGNGDLTVDVKIVSERDSLGHALQKMVGSLRQVVSSVMSSATQINSGTSQVSDASGALSQGATEQAASIEEISSSMTELGSQTRQNAENATQANTLSVSTRDSAEHGSDQMAGMVDAMAKIGESSKEIAKIIKVIDDIAFQTNLLALNAAVEAARAGKYGKGFAVVAEEVRTLAARSAKAAKETSELIEGSGVAVNEGVKMSQKTAEALEGIVGSARKTADLVGEIAAASNEQAQGIAQINIGLDQIDKVTQQNTASAEETASAAEELSSQTHELKRMMGWFKTGNQNQFM